GALVERVTAYRTVAGPGGQTLTPLLRAGGVEAVTFTSSSTVRYLLDGLADGHRDQARQLLNGTALVCIGPATAQTARDEGLTIAAQAREYTSAGVVAALASVFADRATKETL
ncbi:MAG: uroporphyrinogen-III synthase, partial [Roseiflexaceae bacterium]|nr:uroporphyrinogen-III synthase [Roseiflexaceae bacterium]